ncbi:MAG: HDIG domain-containing protein [Gemmatimonadales bacterium]|jgi:putative nucleotidyltransferase with HDIG domain
MSRESRISLNLELAPSDLPGRVAFHALRWGLLVALAVLTYVAFPVAGRLGAPQLTVNDVAPTEIIAPFAFEVRKPAAEIEREAAQLEATARPIYEYQPATVDSVLAETDSLFAALAAAGDAGEMVTVAQQYRLRLTPEEASYLSAGRRLEQFRAAVRRLLRDELRRGVPPAGTLDSERTREIVLRRPEAERVATRDTLLTYDEFLESRFARHPDNSSVGDPLYVKLLTRLFQPTLLRNTAEYEARRRELRASVDSVKYFVRPNERIVDANEVVTEDVAERLVALQQEWLRRGGGSEAHLTAAFGQVLANGLILTVFWLLLMLYRPYIYNRFQHILTMAVLFGLVIVGASVSHRFLAPAPELIPVPFAAMLATVLFRGRVAMVAAMVLAVLIASQAAFGGTDAVVVTLIGGVAAAVSVRTIRRRNQFLTAAALVAGAYLLAGVAIGLRLDWSIAEVGYTGLRGGLNALASAALASTLLPVVEWVSGVTTDLTLLELSDPDRPLLRRLATEAPGTYAHSIAMANLCEAACNAIGAKGLLARVGCYYHDVGKLKKPQFFVENQSPGTNPHDKLKPEVSAGIIRNHVKEGIQLAEDHKVPDVVRAFIPEHHGTMEITYFLERARARTSDPQINPEEYRYPGPKPQSVETAVAMLADGVEAAARVLEDSSPERLSDAIDHIIRQRIEHGQLEETPLTLAQLARVRDEFVRILGGAHHNRIDYPAAAGGIGADWEATSPA